MIVAPTIMQGVSKYRCVKIDLVGFVMVAGIFVLDYNCIGQ